MKGQLAGMMKPGWGWGLRFGRSRELLTIDLEESTCSSQGGTRKVQCEAARASRHHDEESHRRASAQEETRRSDELLQGEDGLFNVV
mmetsp:Transcript_71695/g.233069  ORF Transcript_71695/g.233069 Transcript_71695/m.233069 type:complete len:87 (-) Transcript_71695:83-343(-)